MSSVATFRRGVGEDGCVDCAVAREALSARIDGEREPVPSARVDEHVRRCAACAAWYEGARRQAVELDALVGGSSGGPAPADIPSAGHRIARAVRRSGHCGLRIALAVVGLAQLGLAAAQTAGVSFGMVADHHGAATGAHLLNESTAWSAALGVVAIAAAFRPRIALGLGCVLVAYAAFLSYYVVADVIAGQVTAARIVSHAPIAAVTTFAVLVWLTGGRTTPPPASDSRPEQLAPRVGLRLAVPNDQVGHTENSAA